MKRQKSEMLQEIAEQYRAAGESWPATAHMIAGWAIHSKLWKPHPGSLVGQCAKEIASALREEYFTDPQGRRVRKKHCYRAEQLLLWVDVQDAQPQEMQGAFQYRRLLILGDCRQLRVDVDSYNENNHHGAHIQMCFDFTKDLEELAQPTQYAGIA